MIFVAEQLVPGRKFRTPEIIVGCYSPALIYRKFLLSQITVGIEFASDPYASLV